MLRRRSRRYYFQVHTPCSGSGTPPPCLLGPPQNSCCSSTFFTMCNISPVGEKTWCVFLLLFLLISCTFGTTATLFVSERLQLSMPPPQQPAAAARPLARLYTRGACDYSVTSVVDPQAGGQAPCRNIVCQFLTGVLPLGLAASRARYCVALPVLLPSHYHTTAVSHLHGSSEKVPTITTTPKGDTTTTTTSPASGYIIRGNLSNIVRGGSRSSTFASSRTSSTGTSFAFPLQENQPRFASCVANRLVAPTTSASGERVPWSRLPCLAGFVSSSRFTHSFRTTLKYAFLTEKRQFLRRSSRCSAPAAANGKKGEATMQVPETPVVLSGEPLCIPIVGCKPAENVAIGITSWKNTATFSGDLIIFGLPSCKSSHGAAPSEGVKEGKKNQKGLASFSPEIREMDKKLTHGMLHDAAQHEEFEAKLGTHMGVRVPGSEGTGKKILHAVALGLGAAAELKPAAAAKAGAAIAALLHRPGYNKVKELGLVWPRTTSSPEAPGAAVADTPAGRAAAAALQQRLLQSFLESFLVEMQPDTRFKGETGGDKEKKSHLEKITIYAEEMDENAEKNIEAGRILARSVYFAQELVNAPANYCNPVTLAHAAVQMAKKVGIAAEVLQQKELEKLGMFSYLSVNKGSLYPPQFIHLTYKPKAQSKGTEGEKRQKRIVFVGKGVCFDSGGYNIKSAASMIELMKFDMAGGAAVLAAVLALGHLQPPNVEVHAVVAACENMVSDKSYRPGDVITAADGKTIEVGNTDAEGRLTLADALIYAEKYLHPDVIVDVATLTGAVIVALGHRYAALYSTCDTLADHLLHSAENSGELMWRMPLVKEYAEALESKIADLQNVGVKNKAGSILGAVFLEQFVQSTPWAHLDIAGTAWDTKRSRATGYGVRTLVKYALEISRQQGVAAHEK